MKVHYFPPSLFDSELSVSSGSLLLLAWRCHHFEIVSLLNESDLDGDSGCTVGLRILVKVF
jgi:hypothetical protein